MGLVPCVCVWWGGGGERGVRLFAHYALISPVLMPSMPLSRGTSTRKYRCVLGLSVC